jgi:hypothetical protein
MRPLIDTDVLLYEVGFASETRNVAAEGTAFEETSIVPKNWDFAKEVFDNRIKLICDEVEATEPPLFFLTECGHQASVGPLLVDELGSLTNRNQGKVDKLGKNKPLKVLGTGSKFFYYQLLTGDSTDNIQGIMGRGPAFAYNLLKDVATDRECYELVAEVYVKTYGDVWEEKLREMADLLYIIKDTDEEGNLVKWTKPKMLLLV